MASEDRAAGAEFTEHVMDTANSAAYIVDDLRAEVEGVDSREDYIEGAVAAYKAWIEDAIGI